MLAWLDSDRERAGQKYEEIRCGLIKIFVCQGCTDPEGLADETINRVIRKIPEIVPDLCRQSGALFLRRRQVHPPRI